MKISGHVHVSGVGGVGMNAVAQLLADQGCRVTGSDRFLDQGRRLPVFDALEAAGVELVPQDGSGLSAETSCLVISTAVEADNPERVAARQLGVPERHRADVLAGLCGPGPLAAVAGTSGKTTCTGWLAWVLTESGLDPNMVNGAAVSAWRRPDAPGNVRRADGGHWWVVEVDESDRSLLRFHPRVALINTIAADHFPLEETQELFRSFARQVEEVVVCGPGVREVLEMDDGIQARLVDAGDPIRTPLPGAHNDRNAASVRTMARACGAEASSVRTALHTFPGVERRLECHSPPESRGKVYDDYAHNPEKMAAAMLAVRPEGGRLIALWRPHGFAPLQNNFDGYVQAFRDTMRPGDMAWILPVFYAGGTAPRGRDAEALVQALVESGVEAQMMEAYPHDTKLAEDDVLLVMGARDPELPEFAKEMGRKTQVDRSVGGKG